MVEAWKVGQQLMVNDVIAIQSSNPQADPGEPYPWIAQVHKVEKNCVVLKWLEEISPRKWRVNNILGMDKLPLKLILAKLHWNFQDIMPLDVHTKLMSLYSPI
jgi:hypothetical protein